MSMLLLNGCQLTKSDNNATKQSISKITKTASVLPREENKYLSQEQAFKRSNRVSQVNYKLNFALTGDEIFTASSTINFTLNDASQPLTVDLNEAQLNSIVINGKK